MRAGLSTIQQTLTPEAAAVINRSIAEAARRSHGQTTPLHVAATLLSGPSGGILRQACIRSHPSSSHPLQCRALELCFSVALDRLPCCNSSSTTSSSAAAAGAAAQPHISNALMAALKRSQAHQRRGFPEQQQQPLLAVKVELEQLVVSILDDPSVSRVMREAGFSSLAVKASIEQCIASNSSSSSSSSASMSLGLGPLGLTYRTPPPRNLYMNPRLYQTGAEPARSDEVKRMLDIMTRPKKRNPVLVSDADSAPLMREVLQRIRSGDAPPPLDAAHVVSLEREFMAAPDRSLIPAMIREMGSSIESRIGDGVGCGVVLDLGNLKWLVENLGVSPGSASVQQQQIVLETGHAVVAEMAKLLARFGDGGRSRVWIVGTATCATYLRCKIYHTAMENDWDLQAVPIAPRLPNSNMFQSPHCRIGGNGILSRSIESLNPTKGLPALDTKPSPQKLLAKCARTTLCAECMQSYERELADLVAKVFEKSSCGSKPEARQTLPHWLQSVKPSITTNSIADEFQSKEQELMRKQSTEQLLTRWRETCSRLHSKSHPLSTGSECPQGVAFPVSSANNLSTIPPLLPFQSKLTLAGSIGSVPMSSHHDELLQLAQSRSETPPVSPVKTDLVLRHPMAFDAALEKNHWEHVKNSIGCIHDEFSEKQRDKTARISNLDSFKRLSKGLAENVGWQAEAASAIATTVMQCKSGNCKPRSTGPRGDTWLLFVGPDKVGKRNMAIALSELMFQCSLTTVHLSACPQTDIDDGEADTNSSFRGKTSLDRIVEAVRRNPFSVILLEGIDRADGLVRGSIKRAIEKGRIADSQRREVGLGSVVFILTSDWLPEELKRSHDSIIQCEERILNSANFGWQLELSIGEKSGKRGAEKFCNDHRPTKVRKESLGGALSLDLNLAVGVEDEDDTNEGSRNSSDLTVEHGQEAVRLAVSCPASSLSAAAELMEYVDAGIVFKPVDFGPLRKKVFESISAKFTSIMGNGRFILVEEDALDLMVGGVWRLAGAAIASGFEDWIERVLTPGMQQLKNYLRAGDGTVVIRLSAAKGGRRQWAAGEWLPETLAIAVGGL